MDILLVLNIAAFAAVFIRSIHRFRRGNPRLWLRIPGAFIGLYVCSVYTVHLFGILHHADIAYFMRPFQLVMAAYMFVEANQG